MKLKSSQYNFQLLISLFNSEQLFQFSNKDWFMLFIIGLTLQKVLRYKFIFWTNCKYLFTSVGFKISLNVFFKSLL
ncbi:MAG: hypothetical protein H9Q65_03595 [Spiroplasma ixodetis]|nr:hypothetical protein [Spiroplasma ixodetis]MBP1526863.1 hypothetical protein [Spiroplasma ixodetis]MBP1528320.1 hypothetical protein [Spiroplasma ixodetis]